MLALSPATLPSRKRFASGRTASVLIMCPPHPRPLVFIVDGAPASLAVAARVLAAGGCDAASAATGEDALAQLEFLQPDVVVLETSLPGRLDGYEVCRRLQADDRWRHLPVVFLSAFPDAASRVRGFEAGATDCLARAIHPTELVARLRAHARTGSRLRKLQAQNADLRGEVARSREHEDYLRRSLDRAVITGVDRRVGFCTLPARRLLERFFPDHRSPDVLPPALAAWLADGALAPWRLERDGCRLEVSLQSGPPAATAGRRFLLTLVEHLPACPGEGPASLARLGLTPRETEVLYWIAHGKTNPETGIILRAAPNTIKKHMQNIMLKLGVETRLAAASRALEVIGLS